jgi:GAF domain-containing protein
MPDANNAVESSTVIQKRTDKLGSEEALHLPITVRGQQIGTVRFIKDQSEADWSAEEISLLSTVVDQLGIALESARLYEETRRRAERERLTSEIVTKMRASNDPQTIIQTAVLELRKALQVDRAQLLVKTASDREIDRSNLPETGEDQPAAGERS